jgi:prepilin-type N-terminal cleavage/methylation domain-containing protein/prepilin-type processing-associated H-X9-DG protein
MIRLTNRHGFTLVEMLVIMALIALLIVLLLPALSKVRENGRVVLCAAHERQLLTAITYYANENEDTLPAARQGPTYAWVQSPWNNQASVTNGILFTYVSQDYKAYICPTFEMIYKGTPGNANSQVAFTYSMSEYVGNSWQSFDGLYRVVRIKNPSGMLAFTDEDPWSPVFVDGVQYQNVGINNGALGVGSYNNPGSIVDGIGTYHFAPPDDLNLGLANVTFFDGHTALHHVSESKELATPLDAR